MISKKKLTAIVVAGLFVTPVMAGKVINKNGIQGQDMGYLTADDNDFKTALEESLKSTNDKNSVRLSMWGKTSDDNDGSMQLNLTSQEGHKAVYVLFGDNSTQVNAHHRSTLNMTGTSLEVSRGLLFRNASNSIERKSDGSYDESKLKELTNTSTANLTNSTLKGDVINQYSTFEPTKDLDKSGYYYQISLKNNTHVSLTNSHWIGDFKDEIGLKSTSLGKPVNKDDVNGEYVVSLKDGSSWTGGVDIAKNSTIEVTLDGTSSWTVNKDSKVNSIQFDTGAAAFKAAEKNGVVLADGVTLTVADGINGKTSTIDALQTGAGSTLAVEKANVTLKNFAGKGDIVLNKDGKVTVNAASDKVNATFTSLEGSKFTTADKVDANVLVAGALVDEKGMDAVIAEYNQNNNYTGNGTVTFSGGLINDTVTGKNDAQGNFVIQNVQKNAQLVSIGESTAITMMQWRADADDMYQRMGDLRNNNGSVGVWARTFGGKAEAGHVDNKYYGVQAGVDTQVATTGPKQFVGGAVSYTTGDATFANGTGDNYMGTFTGYSTWLFDNGSYVDVAAKVGKLNNEFDLAVEGKKLAGKYSTQAIALTVESGHRFPVTNLTYVEPQVAFTASHIFGEDYGATNGVTIEQDSINSYVARVGVQAGLNCPDNMGSVFVRASYLYDFDGETSTVARKANAKDGNRFDQDFGGGWYELGLGMNVNFTKNLYGYADFEYVTGGEIKTPYRWNAGVRYAF